MKKLGVYVGDLSGNIEKNTFVWYEVFRKLTAEIGEDVYDVDIWILKNGYPNRRIPDARFKTANKHLIENTIIPMKDIPDKYCIEWENKQWQIKECEVHYDYYNDYEFVTTLKLDQFGSNNYCHWEWKGERTFSVLKTATVYRIYKIQDLTFAGIYPKKSLEQDVIKSALNSLYGKSAADCSGYMGGFAIPHSDADKVLAMAEAFKLFNDRNKETKTMKKKKMTETDLFLKNLNGITITSTYAKLDHGCAQPYYIYYPEMEITDDIADTLLTVLLMAKRDNFKKVVFNPVKGTTTLARTCDGYKVTVRCRDSEFDYILGYEMAKSKMYIGSDDYNWFNKIKNHRKTHIEYTEKPTEPKAKRTSKKGGKK